MEILNRKETLSVMIYLYNRWNQDEAITLFGKEMGRHIFSKYVNMDTLKFICEIDGECLDKIVNRACECYIGRTSRDSEPMRNRIRLMLTECKCINTASPDILDALHETYNDFLTGTISYDEMVEAKLKIWDSTYRVITFDDASFEEIEKFINSMVKRYDLRRGMKDFNRVSETLTILADKYGVKY